MKPTFNALHYPVMEIQKQSKKQKSGKSIEELRGTYTEIEKEGMKFRTTCKVETKGY